MSGYVYFIRAEKCKLVKIGFTENPYERFQQIRTLNADVLTLVAFLPGTRDDEQALHRVFSKERRHGEWFRLSKALAAHIETVLATYEQKVVPPPPRRVEDLTFLFEPESRFQNKLLMPPKEGSLS